MSHSGLVHDGVLKHLAGLAVRQAHDPDGVRIELEQIPVSVIEAVLDDDGELDWQDEDRLRLLELLALDPRDYVRLQAATRAAVLTDVRERLEALLERLCADDALAVRQAAATTLATVLQHVEGITRTRLVGSWTLSNYRALRSAIAHALRWPFPVVGAPSAIELLAADEDPEVRAAAAEAAKIRMRDAPRLCSEILRRLARDPDPQVRRAAALKDEHPQA